MSANPNESNQSGDGGDLVSIAEVESDVEANAIAAELQDAGFDARMVSGSSGGFFTDAVDPVRVLVPADQAEAAKKLADEILEEAKNIDWDDIDVGEMED